MTATTVEPARPVLTSVTPYLTVHRAEALIEFVKQTFDAKELHRAIGSAGGIHAEVRIGDATLMIGGGGAWRGEPRPTALHVYVKDADTVYRRALEAGAVSKGEPVDQVYGDREAAVQDPFGNRWYIATHQGRSHIPEGLRSVTPYLHPRGTAQVIDFLQRAFAAEEALCHRTPDGTVLHAKVKIGESIVELGEAHGEIQPMPTVFYLNVPDVITWYERAVRAGARSLSEPTDQPYGARVASVDDGFGNTWYLATPLADLST